MEREESLIPQNRANLTRGKLHSPVSHKSFTRTGGTRTHEPRTHREEKRLARASHTHQDRQDLLPAPLLCPAPMSLCPQLGPSVLNSAPRGAAASRAPSARTRRGGARQKARSPSHRTPPLTRPQRPARSLRSLGASAEPREPNPTPGRPAGGAHQGAEILPAEVRLPQSHSRLVPRHLGPRRK